MNNKYSVACITLVRDKYKINRLNIRWYIRPIRFENSIRNRIGRPIRFEIRFERKKTIRGSLIIIITTITNITWCCLIARRRSTVWMVCTSANVTRTSLSSQPEVIWEFATGIFTWPPTHISLSTQPPTHCTAVQLYLTGRTTIHSLSHLPALKMRLFKCTFDCNVWPCNIVISFFFHC